MIVFSCHVCRTSLSAEDPQAGQMVRCPTCLTTLRVPIREQAAIAVGAPQSNPIAAGPRVQFQPGKFGGKRYGFNCGYCSSRLEATEAMAAQEGQCPTCGNQITIPIQDRYGRLIDPKTRQIIKQDPHPVHAYAAAGERAPKIVRGKDDRRFIVCPRCASSSPITANNCKNCGMPFTMEGTTLEAPGSSNGFCIASLVLGIISIPGMTCVGIPSALAIIFGIIGLVQTHPSETSPTTGGRGLAIAGIILGVIGGLLSANFFHLF
jgi:DNA-directed RNA polymerase subunit RPC12/RpoP